MNVLRPVGAVQPLRLEESFDIDSFLQFCGSFLECEGSTDFIFLAEASPEDSLEFSPVSFDLVRSTSNEGIWTELPQQYLFVNGTFCAFIAQMVQRQRDGGEGDLLTNGHSNIFYVRNDDIEVCVVLVLWDVSHRKWCLYIDPLSSSCRWFIGHRIFASNCKL